MKRELELAWCAGLIDGEGCISITRRNVNTGGCNKTLSHAQCVQVNMVHLDTLRRIQSLLGCGNICRHSSCKLTKRQAWSWSATGQKAIASLALVRPYLYAKADEADLVMSFYDLGRAWGGRFSRSVPPELIAAREDLCERVRALKWREWPANLFKKPA